MNQTILEPIRTIEELSLNAWPALQTLLFDGWVIRFANGYTKRANSVNPLYGSTIDIKNKIHICEQLYRNQNLPVVFKMTPAVYPQDLDSTLEECGYQIESGTSVRTLDLMPSPVIQGTESCAAFSEEWLQGFCRLNNLGDETRSTIRQMFENTVPRKYFATIRLEDRGIAYGLGILQNEHIGIFDIITDPSVRNLGFGTQIMSNLLAWGTRHQARKAYLQVMLDNAPALHLYSRLGFQELYQYWYRIKR